jgi:hypothetical protein
MSLTTVYIETSVASYVVARPSQNLMRAARQLSSIRWWETYRGSFEVFTSAFTLDEAQKGDPDAAAKRIALLEPVQLLQVDASVLGLMAAIEESKILPDECEVDVGHISIASRYEIEVLLTWNCRHIANPILARKLEPLIRSMGYKMPYLATPTDLLGDDDEEIK